MVSSWYHHGISPFQNLGCGLHNRSQDFLSSFGLHNFLINPNQAHVILAIIEFIARLSPESTYLLDFKVQILHFGYGTFTLLPLFPA